MGKKGLQGLELMGDLNEIVARGSCGYTLLVSLLRVCVSRS